MNLPKRKSTRLRGYDYSENGAYFITICSEARRCIFSEIVEEEFASPEVRLSSCGKAAEEELQRLSLRFLGVSVQAYVMMPNHIHLLLLLQRPAGGASSSPTVIQVVQTFKSLVTRRVGCGKIFQRSFYDHVIRNERDYEEILMYIQNNPAKWALDRFYPGESSDGIFSPKT